MKIQAEFINQVAEELKKANRIWLIGNGGSASLANHFACDLLKNCGLPAISLCSNMALITAIANDENFKEIFVHQLNVLFKKGDKLIAFSTSGNSLNVIMAAKYIYLSLEGTVIGIAGFNGGELKNQSHIFYQIDSFDVQECENEMNILCHEIYKQLMI